jgi:hypothetical protein
LILTTILVQFFEFSEYVSMVSEATLDADIWQVPGVKQANTPIHDIFVATLEPEVQSHYAYLMTRCLSNRQPDSALSLPEQEVCRSLAERKKIISSKPIRKFLMNNI